MSTPTTSAPARPPAAGAGGRAARGSASAARRRGGSPRRPRGPRRSATRPEDDVVRARLVDAVAVSVLLEEVGHRARELGAPLGIERLGKRARGAVGVEEVLPDSLA